MYLPTAVVSLHSNGALTKVLSEVVAATDACYARAAESPESALKLLRRGSVGLLVYLLTGGDREPELVGFLNAMKEAGIRVPVLVVCHNGDPELRLRLLRRGVADCLSPPVDVSRLAFLVDYLTLQARLRPIEAGEPGRDNRREADDRVADFLFSAPPMRRLLEHLRPLAQLDTTLLITGETGTGKSHLARVVHELSPRRDRPLAVVHCGALSSALIRSELFGHVRGAFTGADSDRTGRFADAEDGTILVDEIDCVPLDVQANLLRVVEDRAFERVGSGEAQPLRARLVVTSNRCLEDEVAEGRFRADLYHRLNVVNLALPPLREVGSLLPSLAEKFLDHYCRCADRPPLEFSAQALEAMLRYPWPGNVRELRNMAERSAALCRGTIVDLPDLPECVRRLAAAPDAPVSLTAGPHRGRLASARHDFESKVLSDILWRHNNNRTEAAAELGVSRVTLYRKLHRYGLI